MILDYYYSESFLTNFEYRGSFESPLYFLISRTSMRKSESNYSVMHAYVGSPSQSLVSMQRAKCHCQWQRLVAKLTHAINECNISGDDLISLLRIGNDASQPVRPCIKLRRRVQWPFTSTTPSGVLPLITLLISFIHGPTALDFY